MGERVPDSESQRVVLYRPHVEAPEKLGGIFPDKEQRKGYGYYGFVNLILVKEATTLSITVRVSARVGEPRIDRVEARSGGKLLGRCCPPHSADLLLSCASGSTIDLFMVIHGTPDLIVFEVNHAGLDGTLTTQWNRSSARDDKITSGISEQVRGEVVRYPMLRTTDSLDKAMAGISEVTGMTQPTAIHQPDTRKVFVVHGRDERLRRDFFAFLRSLGLTPIEWSEAVQMTGKGSPYIGEVLDVAFNKAQAVVVLLTPDDEVRLLPELSTPADPLEEREYRFQARPNVLFEAGMAFGRNPERTVLIEVGDPKRFSDVAGRHAVRLTNDPGERQEVANRLRTAGCLVSTVGRDWFTAGDFSAPRSIASPEWYGIRFTTPGAGTTTIQVSPLSISGKFEHRPPDGALHIFVVSEDRNRWWPVAEAVLKDSDRTWSAKVPFDQGDFGVVVVAALVSERSVDLVQYFEKLPHHLATSERRGYREFKERKEFDSLFRDIMSDGIKECDSRNIRVKI